MQKSNKEQIYNLASFLLGAGGGIMLLLIFSDIDIPQPLIMLIGIIIGSILTFFGNRLLSKQSFKQQLLLANLKKNIVAHQQAFHIWWDIRSNIHNRDKIFDVVIQAQKWWKQNCLYMLPKSRKAFYDCLIFATSHRDLIEVQNKETDYKKYIKESWDVIVAPGLIIPEEIDMQSFEDQDKLFKLKSPPK